MVDGLQRDHPTLLTASLYRYEEAVLSANHLLVTDDRIKRLRADYLKSPRLPPSKQVIFKRGCNLEDKAWVKFGAIVSFQ